METKDNLARLGTAASYEVLGGADLALVSRAVLCAPQVVEAWGHPTPGPTRFCRVKVLMPNIVNWDSIESSVGNAGTDTLVLFMQ